MSESEFGNDDKSGCEVDEMFTALKCSSSSRHSRMRQI